MIKSWMLASSHQSWFTRKCWLAPSTGNLNRSRVIPTFPQFPHNSLRICCQHILAWHTKRAMIVGQELMMSSWVKRCPAIEACNGLHRHEWFALRRLITNSRNSAFTGGFWYSFLKETSQLDGRTKDWISKGYSMDHCGKETLRRATDKPISRWPTAQPNHPLMWPSIVLS